NRPRPREELVRRIEASAGRDPARRSFGRVVGVRAAIAVGATCLLGAGLAAAGTFENTPASLSGLIAVAKRVVEVGTTSGSTASSVTTNQTTTASTSPATPAASTSTATTTTARTSTVTTTTATTTTATSSTTAKAPSP